MGQDFSSRKCQPCHGGVKPLDLAQASTMLKDIPGWTVEQEGLQISREYVMKDFAAAVDLIQAIAPIAEQEDHHPDLHLTGYRKLRIVLTTHAIGGLSENDFILAAKIEKMPKELKEAKR